ncbi:chemotaxis protein CheB [Neorhodopirellula pilleata]|uniref:protein-glutamate O-methyltransferase n=1 Tax=Neorhodopirellula pilleata TaxID=2714738 RepID=A0A5C6AFH2_9BACT|nr:chemotaxis protein CheB [Neorhodopirellula pilleata]TWT98782.1 Chemotaxis protein methyltransferase [Neorhodopirellula pilleata]
MTTELLSKPILPALPMRFPIVGVVTSAGGLTALKQLLGAVAVDCGMAFVLVPHLDPKQESQMVAILSRDCVLPVVEATDAMVPEPNHVYVIPSKFYLTIRDGAFQLSEPTEPEVRETAIDIFLRSLAKDQGEHSIGIVLSGTGSHGTLGIRDIKLAGGMAIAQEPSTAEFDSMPSSVIREGLSDCALPPAEMPGALVRYMRQPYLSSATSATTEIQAEDGQLDAILEILRKHTQFDFRCYRQSMMLRRVQRRMGLHQLETFERYLQRLKNDPAEITALYRDLLISVTAFFRDPEAYEALSAELRANLVIRDADRFPLRVWVPGCATGEEAYSLAILLIECLDDRSESPLDRPSISKPIHLFASDVDEAAIAIARTGIYPTSISTDVSEDRLERFFTEAADAHYQIGKQLRDAIIFSRQHVISDPPFSKLDLISCRNLLIYLEPEMQQRVLSMFHFALADDGLLILGPAESLGHASDLFKPISKKWRIFQKLPTSRRKQLSFPIATTNASQSPQTNLSTKIPPRQAYKALVEKSLITHYAPATALINRRYEVLYVTGPMTDYLEFPAGELTPSLMAMCRPGLRTKLRFACQKCFAEETNVSFVTAIERGEDSIQCRVNIRVEKLAADTETLLLVNFVDKPSRGGDPSKPKHPQGYLSRLIHRLRFGPSSLWRDQLRQASESNYVLEMELAIQGNTEELGGVIAELEGANEDLKSSNEEIMSMNEELQSANEELETSKEELQSLNEELSTVNIELLDKVNELDVANNDILNLIASTEIATLFLDTDLHIQRFTPPTVALFNLRLTDLGRPLGDITPRFDDAELRSDCRKVIEGSEPIQHEIVGQNSRLYLRRILPYRSKGDHVSGVVITFVDLTDQLTLERSLKESKDHILEIASNEQQRIGQELHDGTQQELTGLSLIAGTIEDLFAQKVQAKGDDHDPISFSHEEMSRCMETSSRLVRGLKEANQHVQSLSHGIMPVQVDAEGLQSALTELASTTTVIGKVACSFVQHGTPSIESNTVATHLYRIAQEAVNNAQRHGKATDIRISLSTGGDQTELEVSDNGIGVDEANLRQHRREGMGLQIMEYRALVIGGVLSISPGTNDGTIVQCTITT